MAMLRDGLRAELPELFELASRLRPPTVPAMPLWAAVVGAVGARTLTDQLIVGFLSVASFVSSPLPPVRTVEPRTIAAAAVGIVFAFGAAGSRGLRAAGGLFAALWLVQFLVTLPGIEVFCSRSRSLLDSTLVTCDPLRLAANGSWPVALGIAVGVAARGLVRHGAAGRSALALALGGWALALAVLSVVLGLVMGPAPEARSGPDAFGPFTWFIAAAALSAAALGLGVGRWGRRHIVDALVIAAVFVLPWLPQARLLWATPEEFRSQLQWQMFSPLVFAAAALAGLVIGWFVRAHGREAPPA